MADSGACYVCLRICILTPLVSFKEELSDREEDALADFDFVHVSDGSESEDSETNALIRKARVSLSPSPLITGNLFFTPSSCRPLSFRSGSYRGDYRDF